MTAGVLARRLPGSTAVRCLARAIRLAPRDALIGYGVPVAAAVAATLVWFAPGGFVASGDVTPFVRDSLAAELASPWSHQLTGAGSASYEVARAVEVAAVRLAGVVGASEVSAQLLLFAACFGFAAFGAAYLAGALVRKPAAIAAAGLLGAFNSFALVNLPNLLPLVAIGLTGLLVGMLWRRARARLISPLAFALATLPVSYLAVNPPLVAVVAVSVAAGAAASALIAGREGRRRALGLLARAVPLVLLLNLWWAVPLGLVTLGGAGSDFTAETDVSAWSWSHVRNSLANVASLNAHWGWTYPEYFPYARQLDQGMWPVLRWAFPALAVAGLVLSPRRWRPLAWGLGAAAAVLVLLGKGLHPPLSGLNLQLYETLPGFWLLREPVSKLGVSLVLVYVVLVALAWARMGEATAGRRTAVQRAGGLALGAVVVGALAYPWPLWTGDVVPNDRGTLPSGHVELPAGWQAAATAVNESPARGKALVLPLPSYYQVTTDWGYHGADAIPQQLLTRPTLQQLPGGYFGNGDGVEALLVRTQEALEGGDRREAVRLLRSLGVSHVLVRHDLVADTQSPTYVEPERLSRTVAALPGARRVFASPETTAFEIDRTGPVVSAYSTLVATDLEELGASVGELATQQIATTSGSTAVDGVHWTVPERRARFGFDLIRAGEYAIESGEAGSGLFRAAVAGGPTEASLALRDTATVSLDGTRLRPRAFRIPLENADVRAIEMAGRLRPFEAGTNLLRVGDLDAVQPYAAIATSSLLEPFSTLEDCDARDGRTPAQAGLSLTKHDETVSLSARAHSACTWATIDSPNPGAAFELRLAYRSAEGAPARICVWQDGPDRCVALPTLPEGEGWQLYRTAFRGSPRAERLRLYLYADGGSDGGTRVDYRDVEVVSLQPAGPAVRPIDGDRAAGRTTWLTPGRHQLEVVRELPVPRLGQLSGLEDCGASDSRTPDEAGLRLRRHRDGSIELGARAHIACAWASAGRTKPDTRYRLSFEHRTLSGRPARLCVWQVGIDRCARLPDFPSGAAWSSFSTTFRPARDTRELRLYLYADGEESGPATRVQYRDPVLEPALPATIAVARHGHAPTPPVVEWEEERPDRYRVKIRGASAPFTLALAESFAPGWSLEDLPRGWTAEHIEVNGYANGWRIQGHGSTSLVIAYGPATPARLATAISLVGGLVCAGLWLLRAVRRRREPPPAQVALA